MKIYKQIAFAAVGLVASMGFVACEDQPDKFELSGGVPVVKYIRVTDPLKADSLITSAYMDNLICLVGDNLTSIREMYFNDKKAILNTSYITDHTLLVSVPKDIPGEVSDKIYMHTSGGKVVEYDFHVIVPQPSVRSISNEFAKPGDVVTITGDYFIDDPNVPLSITFPNNVPVTEIKSLSKNSVSFVVPDGASSGRITVTSIYGTSKAAFNYGKPSSIDDGVVLFDWDGNDGALAMGNGWRAGDKVLRTPGMDEFESIDGNYILFATDIDAVASATWAEDQLSFNYWSDDTHKPLHQVVPAFGELLAKYSPADLQVKFEILVPKDSPWQSAALQIIFASAEQCASSNAYFTDTTVPRGLWNPWQSTGSYDTDGEWRTVAIPLRNSTYTHDGQSCGTPLSNPSSFDTLTFFVYNGGVNGTSCSPRIAIDNIRVTPIE